MPARIIVGLFGLNLAFLAALLITGLPASAANADGIVRAKAFELVDEKGRVRALLNIEEGGEAVLRLRDATGEIRVKLGANREGSGLVPMDRGAEPAIHMPANSSGPTIAPQVRDKPVRTIAP
jgi:hypothetical protein